MSIFKGLVTNEGGGGGGGGAGATKREGGGMLSFTPTKSFSHAEGGHKKSGIVFMQ